MGEEPLDAITDEELADVPDSRLQVIAGDAILGAAVMNGSRWADQYHKRVDRVYAECSRRKRGIYQRAFNEVARSQGHHGMVSEVKPGTA